MSEAKLAELVRADRLEEAARLAEELGRQREAARLWEQACRFDQAARCLMAAGDAASALVLAARAGALDVERQALDALSDVERLRGAMHELVDAGLLAAAGRAALAAGDTELAGRHFERAGEYRAAASAFERGGSVLEAARCLERADDDSARVELGRLLLSAGRPEDAARVLQRIAPDAPERVAALRLLCRAFADLGMPEAVRELERERELELERDRPNAEPAPAPEAPRKPVDTDAKVLFGRYGVERLVAVTPTAHVYQALDRVSTQRVAVKLLSAAAVRDAGRDVLRHFEREAVALGRLRHPAIVGLLDYVPESPAIVLVWMAGGSLADLLARGPIAPARAAEIALALLSALDEAHRRGILHRDLKPSNVLFDEAGAAHLSDFGVAHVAERAATVTAGILGTLAYMAPEQRAGAAATVQSDVYGVGAILWQCLTGGPPEARMPFLSDDLSAEARAAAAQLLAAPDERPSDARAAQALLQSVRFPARTPPRRAVSVPPPPEPREESTRFEPRRGTLFFDRCLERSVHILSPEPELVARARSFALADHPALAAVLALDEANGRLAIEAVDGEEIEGPLTAAETAELTQALSALHGAGGTHGSLDRQHLVRRGGRIMLRFALTAAQGSVQGDLAALERLQFLEATTLGIKGRSTGGT